MTQPTRIQKRIQKRILIIPLILLWGGCVESRHPVSDQETSKVDERLIGAWRLEDDAAIWTIKKTVHTKNGMELELSEAGTTSRVLLFATTLSKRQYLSAKELGEDSQKDRKEAYDVYEYRFLDNDTVEARGMDPKAIIVAIENEELGGRIETIDGEKTPIITGEPGELARYIEAHADECFPEKSDNSLKWKRQ